MEVPLTRLLWIIAAELHGRREKINDPLSRQIAQGSSKRRAEPLSLKQNPSAF
jgi:hypothetical protein